MWQMLLLNIYLLGCRRNLTEVKAGNLRKLLLKFSNDSCPCFLTNQQFLST